MDNSSQQSAIIAALSHDWNKAVILNETILKKNEEDLEALNRLAYAFTKLGKIEKAKKIYRQILNKDPYNFIAQKNLEKIKSLPKKSQSSIKSSSNLPFISPRQFIEEPGKTKTVSLIHLAPMSVLSKQHIGDTVNLYCKKHSIEIRDPNKIYIGALPDDIAFRLMKFIKAGNTYHVCIKNIKKKGVSVFIREIKRGKKLQNLRTFLLLHDTYSSSTPKAFKSTLRNLDNIEENHVDEVEEDGVLSSTDDVDE